MDNITHTLFALTLARTPLGRGGRAATVALVLASNAPDVDIVAALSGGARYLEWHRGPTHGPLGVVGLGVVTAAMVWGVQTLIGHRAKGKGHGARFGALLVASLVGVLAHILVDVPTSYGTRLLSPFSWRWFAMDLMPIIDVYLWMILAAGIVIGSRSRELGRKSALVVFALMVANYGIRVAAHQDALSKAARIYGDALPTPCDAEAAFGSLLDEWPRAAASGNNSQRCLMDTAAIPTFFSPFEWRVIARFPDAYAIYSDGPTWIPNQWTPLVARAARTPTARALLGFARFPVARVFAEPSGATTVQFTDLRFTTGVEEPDERARRSAPFTATVRFGPGNDILEERLGQ